MSELLEIIIQAVDNASDAFESIKDSVQETDEAIQNSFDGSDFEGMNAALDEANAEVERLTEELAGIYMGDIEGDAEAVEDALAAAQDEAAKLKDEIENTKDQTSETNSEMEGLEGILGGIAGMEVFTQLSDALMDMANKAGTVQDSWTRMGLAAEGAGIDVGSMKGAVTSLASETGRAGGQIRESFIAMTSAGISDMSTMQTLFKGASAQAFILGTDVETLANKFSGMAMKSSIAERTLKGTGITVNELGQALGMQGATIEEINAKWETLSVDQRAAALGMAASMNEGKDANEEYKNSWEGLQAQIDIAKGKLEVLVGKVLLPVLVPAMEVASRVLSWLGDTISAVMDGPLGGLISVIGTVAAVIMLAIPAYMALSTAFTLLTGPALAAAASLWAAVAPLLPFIAIGAAIVFIIYEIGKAFGWWTDIGSMIDAVWAGIQRLWSAFVNHPDVQAAIQAVSSALQTLWGYIQQAGQAIMEFFGIATGGEFDVVRAIIDGVGAAWEIFSGHLTAVVTVFTILISIFQAVGEAIGGFWNDTLLPFGEWLSGVFAPVWQLVADLLNAIEPFVSNLTNAFTLFANGQMSLPGLVWTVLTTLLNAYVTIFSLIMSRVTAWGISLLAKGVSVASNFVNNIVNWLRQLPGRALSALLQVVSSIVSAGSQWVSNATSQASSVVSGVVGRFASLPGQISSALGGVVDAIVSPFRSAYDAVCGVVDSIKSKVQEGLSEAAKLTGFGSDHTEAGGDMPSAYGGDIVPANVEYTRSGNSTVTVEGEVTERLILDFQNVPSHIDTNELIRAMQDKKVLESIARNRDFQSIDSKVKNEIIGKSKRYYGV